MKKTAKLIKKWPDYEIDAINYLFKLSEPFDWPFLHGRGSRKRPVSWVVVKTFNGMVFENEKLKSTGNFFTVAFPATQSGQILYGSLELRDPIPGKKVEVALRLLGYGVGETLSM